MDFLKYWGGMKEF